MQYLANSASRDAKQTRKLILRQSNCRQNVFAQDLAGMCRPPLSIVQHRINSSVIFLKINVEGVFTFKRKRHEPVAVDCDAPCVAAIAF